MRKEPVRGMNISGPSCWRCTNSDRKMLKVVERYGVKVHVCFQCDHETAMTYTDVEYTIGVDASVVLSTATNTIGWIHLAS